MLIPSRCGSLNRNLSHENGRISIKASTKDSIKAPEMGLVIREGMSFVNGAPCHIQDAIRGDRLRTAVPQKNGPAVCSRRAGLVSLYCIQQVPGGNREITDR